jgi:hypothetical protein
MVCVLTGLGFLNQGEDGGVIEVKPPKITTRQRDSGGTCLEFCCLPSRHIEADLTLVVEIVLSSANAYLNRCNITWC